MTRREAKREALRVASLVLDSSGTSGEWWLGRTDRDRARMEAAWEEIVTELDRRGRAGPAGEGGGT